MKMVMTELEKIVDVMDVEESAKREELIKKRRKVEREIEEVERERKRISDQVRRAEEREIERGADHERGAKSPR